MKIYDHGFFGSQYNPGSTLVQAVIFDKEWKIILHIKIVRITLQDK